MIYIAIVGYIVLCTAFCIYLFRQYFLSPMLFFLMFQQIMFIGIVRLIDVNNSADLKLIFLYCVALFGTILGIVYETSRRPLYNREVIATEEKGVNRIGKQRIFFLVIFSVIVCHLFFNRLGINLVSAVYQAINGQLDFSQYRKMVNFASGSGYVYQFRVIILPFLTFYLLMCEKGIRKIIGCIILPFTLFFLVASGQRFGLVQALLMVAVASLMMSHYAVDEVPIYKNKMLIVLMIMAVGFFVALTYLNGRVANSGGLFAAIFDRMIYDNQISAVYAFRYIEDQPIQMGRDWLNMAVDLLPGKNSYVPVASVIHAQLWGGSYEGTAPPCIWGSTYYNFGTIGVFAVAFLIGFYFKRIYSMFVRKRNSKFRLFYFGSLFLALGMWMTDSPMYLFNEGAITLFLLYTAVTLFSGGETERAKC